MDPTATARTESGHDVGALRPRGVGVGEDAGKLAVDGEISPAQRVELDTILASSPEARGYLESMTEISRRIESASLTRPSKLITPPPAT